MLNEKNHDRECSSLNNKGKPFPQIYDNIVDIDKDLRRNWRFAFLHASEQKYFRCVVVAAHIVQVYISEFRVRILGCESLHKSKRGSRNTFVETKGCSQQR
jgi:hypothetical protein